LKKKNIIENFGEHVINYTLSADTSNRQLATGKIQIYSYSQKEIYNLIARKTIMFCRKKQQGVRCFLK